MLGKKSFLSKTPEREEIEDFMTHNSDEYTQGSHQVGVKLDESKLQASLLLDFSLALKRVAEVSAFGARKYTPGGWQFVKDGEKRYYDAFMRHLLDSRHEPFDKESGLPHLYHALWNLLAVVELSERGSNHTEDVPQPQPQTIPFATFHSSNPAVPFSPSTPTE